MDLIYKVANRDYDDTVILHQMEVHDSEVSFFELRFVNVWARSLAAARAIQRQWREGNR